LLAGGANLLTLVLLAVPVMTLFRVLKFSNLRTQMP
jgi:hypothetical protein